jgi:maltooligosyltrehalose trehalohydrolase
VRSGYLYQGQHSQWQKKPRGSPTTGLPPRAFVTYLENHDQVANSPTGERLWRQTLPGRWRAMTGLLLLGPWTPLLFQGQEWSATTPFLFFADHNAELRPLVRKGRGEFLAQFARVATPEMRDLLPDPGAPETLAACHLDWSEAGRPFHQAALALHRDLLALRRSDPLIAAQGEEVRIDGAVLGPACLALRYAGPGSDDRLLVVNLGADLALRLLPEPLLAPPEGKRWNVLWSSESPRYGGDGTPPLDRGADGWLIPGNAAVLLQGVTET